MPGAAQQPTIEPSPYPLQSCEVGAYLVVQEPPKVINIRWGPGGEYAVMGRLEAKENAPIFLDISASRGDWLHFTRAYTVDEKVAYRYKGWIYAPQVQTSLRAASDESVPVYRAPRKDVALNGSLKGDTVVSLLACKGKWIQMQTSEVSGWLAPENQCPNPLTTCP